MIVFREAAFIANACASARISFSCGYRLAVVHSLITQ